MKKLLVLTVMFASVLILSCNSGSPAENNPDKSSSLEGTWAEPVFVSDNSGIDNTAGTADDEWRKNVVTFSGNNVEHTMLRAKGPDLFNLVNTLKLTLKYTFTTGDTVTVPADAKKIDMTQVSATVTLVDGDTVTWANTVNLCGYSDWELNIPKDIAGLTGPGGTEKTNGSKSYNIFKIENNILYVGNETPVYDCTTDASRPVEFMTMGLPKRTELEGMWPDGGEIFTFDDEGADNISGTSDDEWQRQYFLVRGNMLYDVQEWALGKDADSLTTMFRAVITHTLIIGDILTKPAGAKELDMVQVSQFLTPLSEDGVAWLNNQDISGDINWQVNVAVSISGLTWQGYYIDDNGTTYYMIYKIKNDGKLYGGEGVLNEADRPTELDDEGITICKNDLLDFLPGPANTSVPDTGTSLIGTWSASDDETDVILIFTETEFTETRNGSPAFDGTYVVNTDTNTITCTYEHALDENGDYIEVDASMDFRYDVTSTSLTLYDVYSGDTYGPLTRQE